MRWTCAAALLLTACASPQVAADDDPVEMQMCVDRDMLLRQLHSKFDETPIAVGLTSAGGVMELLISKQGRTWTLIVTRPSGLSCLFTAGEGWEPLPAPATEIRF
ncbi:MAG: hypothetical protein EXQ88_02400 [Alphaproteobacteria bacterium]|nr:hypothetical protein [Alphaproteobacteria bacterium]